MIHFLKREWLFLMIVIVPFIIAILVYPYMPDQVPSHWNINGEIDDYSSRTFGAFFLPILNIGMYVLFIILPKLDPKRDNYLKFAGSYRIIRYSIHIFFIILFGLTVLVSLGYPVEMDFWIPVGVAILFMVIGGSMGRVKHNYFVGFKFPWTLANEAVWNRTHQVGSKAMVIGGALALIGVIFTENFAKFMILMIGIFIPVIFTSIYSYLLYKRITK